MTPAGEILRDLIRNDGPIPFRSFMDVALRHPEYGYYRRRDPDPFGVGGDFYTAEQIQPVFGLLMRRKIGDLLDELGASPPRVVELGAGRREMAEFFGAWNYTPVDLDSPEMPREFDGVVFANEFFDALAVDVAVKDAGQLREMRVGFRDDRFVWSKADAVSEEIAYYAERWLGNLEEGQTVEICLDALAWVDRVGAALRRGFLLIIDYGYEPPELRRFPRGTLMSYRRHRAIDDVLVDPGGQDITAHVNFAALRDHAVESRFRCRSWQTLARLLLDAGESDEFAEALAANTGREGSRRRLQLKTLLFGMGETFRVLLLEREADRKKAPKTRGL